MNNDDNFDLYEVALTEYRPVFEEGEDAREAGISLKNCPYNDRRARYWSMGWCDKDMTLAAEIKDDYGLCS
jgi:hypothetical protein